MAGTLDWSAFEGRYAALLEGDLTPAGVPGWLERWSDLEKDLWEAGAAVGRARDEDTSDEAAQAAYLHFVKELVPKSRVAGQALKARLLAVPRLEPQPEHVQMLRRLRAEADLFREENVPILSDLSVLGNEYATLVGGMSVRLNDQDLTLQQAEGRLHEPDRAVREAAWRAVHGRWLESRAQLDDLFLRMLPLRRALARNAGLPDYRAYAWHQRGRFDYTPGDTLAFHEAIEAEVVPLATRLAEARRERLSLERLRPWDHDYRVAVDPEGRPALRPFSSAGELEAGVARMFERLDPGLGAQFATLRDGFLDLGSRKGKAPGGHHSRFPRSNRSYIFMNAAGTHENVTTLLHEGGHAFHFLSSSAQQSLIWNHSGPTEFNEVAAMAMELLASPFLETSEGGFYSPQDAARARVEHLEGIVRFLPYMAVVDAFQHWVYSEAGEEATAADLDAAWERLWARFMPGVDWSGLEAERISGWHRKSHIFVNPFYYVEYGLAQVGALQIWQGALTDPAGALGRYREALALGNTRPLPDLYQAAGAQLAFDRQTLRELMSLVESRLEP